MSVATPRWEARLYVTLVTFTILLVASVSLTTLNATTTTSPPATKLHSTIHITLIFLSLCSYFRAHLTPPGTSADWPAERPDLLHPLATPHARPLYPPALEDGLLSPHASPLPSSSSEEDQPPPPGTTHRWCTPCAAPKPPRVHHCRACGACVLRFDHHCPWVGTCIGLRNVKFFLLFLLYTTLSAAHATYLLFTSFRRARHRHLGHHRSAVEISATLLAPTATAISFVSALALAALLSWNLFLAARNCTALEQYRLHDRHSRSRPAVDYTAPVVQSLRHVLGWNPTLWLLPVHQRRTPPLRQRKCKS